ncbi:MAG: HD domain-containing protein, partial [Thiotrichaceae bacterium]|nr:HD domain-containing protein [Thiotrichaceae bacterium]
MNKKKIINDPLYGFINISSELIFDVVETPVFQRLRRINQMGLADFVYPGALHTRFHHALGAMHLMSRTLDNLRDKGHDISAIEYESALLAILLHDIGHGPFSHSLEGVLIKNSSHEELSLLLMEKLNQEFSGGLTLALEMFTNKYHRKFFHQLISSQLDVDRLDYLNRDSFFTGVSEGTIGAERIIKLFDLVDDEIVVEEKGIYSVENFLNARRLMYWQVYLHKTGLAADKMLMKIIERARHLILANNPDPNLVSTIGPHLANEFRAEAFSDTATLIDEFSALDDHDIWCAIKKWQSCDDKILAYLSKSFINRRLFKIKLTGDSESTHNEKIVNELRDKTGLAEPDLSFLYDQGTVSNAAYIKTGQKIKMLKKTGEVINIDDATDLPNIKAMSRIV